MSDSSSNVVMPALAAVAVVAAVVIGVFYLGGKPVPEESAGTAPTPLPTLSAGEAPEIRTVDIDQAPVADARSATASASDRPASAPDLFASGGRRHALRDGLSSDAAPSAQPPATTPEAAAAAAPLIIDFFDFGQLDQRLRIGVFGRGPIPQYRVRHLGQRYIIDMPGHYTLLDGSHDRRLAIHALGIETAQLFATDNGLRMVIETERQPRHAGFLIEDARGIMIAFEPRP